MSMYVQIKFVNKHHTIGDGHLACAKTFLHATAEDILEDPMTIGIEGIDFNLLQELNGHRNLNSSGTIDSPLSRRFEETGRDASYGHRMYSLRYPDDPEKAVTLGDYVAELGELVAGEYGVDPQSIEVTINDHRGAADEIDIKSSYDVDDRVWSTEPS